MALPFFNAYRGSMGRFFQGDPTLMGYWQLDGNSLDNSGNGNNGTDISVSYSPVYSRFSGGQGGLFNGSSSKITAADSPTLTLDSSFSVGVWVNPSSLPTSGNLISILSKYDGGSNAGGYDLQLRNDGGIQRIALIFINGVTTYGGTGFDYTLPLNRWSYIVGVSNTSLGLISVYVNASLIGSITNGGAVPGDNTKLLNIGAFGFWTPSGSDLGRYFNGYIDEVALFARALSPAEISQYYQWATSQPRKTYYEVDSILASNTRRRLLLAM